MEYSLFYYVLTGKSMVMMLHRGWDFLNLQPKLDNTVRGARVVTAISSFLTFSPTITASCRQLSAYTTKEKASAYELVSVHLIIHIDKWVFCPL